MAKATPQPLTPEQVQELTTTQHMRRASSASQYWLKRSDAILQNPHPTPGQLKAQPWYEQHGLIWGAVAEMLDKLEHFEAAERAKQYTQGQQG